MNFKHVTIIVMIACFAVAFGVLLYDLLPALSQPEGDTISEVTLGWWSRHPIAPLVLGLAVGILFGHLGWPQEVDRGS